MPNRKPKTSYSCAPCKRLKIKCDHNVPCSSCVRNSRQEECLQSPAKSLTQFKELIKPNAHFGRINKQPTSPIKPQPVLSVRKQSKSSSISSISSHDGTFSSPEETYSKQSVPHVLQYYPSSSSVSSSSSSSVFHNALLPSRENSQLMEAIVKDQTTKLDELAQRSTHLMNQNAELQRQVGLYYQLSSRPGIQDFGIEQMSSDKILSMKKMMMELLPARNIGAILKKHYFICVSYLNDVIIDPSDFEKDYEKLWSHIVNDRVVNVDLSFLGLLLMVFTLALRCAPRELMLSNEALLRQWWSAETLEQTCLTWFRASRQILAFKKTPEITRVQIFVLQATYCYLVDDLETLEEILPQAVYDAKKIRLDDPAVNDTELYRCVWWSLCSLDTMRALESHKTPLIMSCYSRVELPEKSSYWRNRAQMCKTLNTIFTHDFYSTGKAAKIQKIIDIDKELVSFVHGFPAQTGKLSRFQRTALYTELCIHRYRLYEAFLQDDIPIASSICTHIVLSIFEMYKTIKQYYIVSQDPLYITLSPILVRAAILSSVFLVRFTRLSVADIDSIRKDILCLQNDLGAMECFSPLGVVSFGVESMKYLEDFPLQHRRRSSDSLKMKLNSIMNMPEQLSIDKVPLSLVNESLKAVEELAERDATGGSQMDTDLGQDEIGERWGYIYEDYCAFIH
ncbi:CYFA0S01e03972g1_1 [Cyberlindnera fabianii]|uniref:CYFA0S01e03972g1_1 n=1 Tax=Cyberlindnera fabianii TaxID=36022 RepID=A0A061APS9_CYBFA|nr:CYFA0S01e03972g1_1 [Cyberlindnera fabianii]